ncbi:hypothetical protein BCU64_002925 [Vibrio lentus]|nr:MULTISPECIES: hypothetical protein [Vibrio]PMH60274.1 hypothetical protein BCU64_19395 [Vibrio lentus]
MTDNLLIEVYMNEKLNYLLNISKLYESFIELTSNDCLKRFLAFKIVTSAMSFEDLIGSRQHPVMRDIRNVFLAHQQNGEFFDGFSASEEICKTNISALVLDMEKYLGSSVNSVVELEDEQLSLDIRSLTKLIIDEYHKEFHEGFRLSNNFLCSGANQIKEISSNPISSTFYRYNSSKELSIFANFFISNFIGRNLSEMVLRSFKVDYILHAVNMWDSIFKDTKNPYSIDGLLEVMQNENIGDTTAISALLEKTDAIKIYKELRWFRNKLAGHMDKKEELSDLFIKLDMYDFNQAFDFVNSIDKAVWETKNTHIALKVHYMSNEKINGENIIEIKGIKNKPYDS